MKHKNFPHRKRLRQVVAHDNLVRRGEPSASTAGSRIEVDTKQDKYYNELATLGSILDTTGTRNIRTKKRRAGGSLGRAM